MFLEVRILKELWVCFLEVWIVKELAGNEHQKPQSSADSALRYKWRREVLTGG